MCALAAERCAASACSSSVSRRCRGSRLPEAEEEARADEDDADEEEGATLSSRDCRASRAFSLDPAPGPGQQATASGVKTNVADSGDDGGGGGSRGEKEAEEA